MKDKKEISISQSIVNKEGGVVILSLREYQKLCAKTVPTYYLEGKEAEEIDSLVKVGLHAFRKGKSKKNPLIRGYGLNTWKLALLHAS